MDVSKGKHFVELDLKIVELELKEEHHVLPLLQKIKALFHHIHTLPETDFYASSSYPVRQKARKNERTAERLINLIEKDEKIELIIIREDRELLRNFTGPLHSTVSQNYKIAMKIEGKKEKFERKHLQLVEKMFRLVWSLWVDTKGMLVDSHQYSGKKQCEQLIKKIHEYFKQLSHLTSKEVLVLKGEHKAFLN